MGQNQLDSKRHNAPFQHMGTRRQVVDLPRRYLLCFGNEEREGRLFVVLGLQYFAAAIKAVRADMVTHMRFTGSRLDCQLRSNQEIVRTMHAALGWGLLILLDSHDDS